HDRPVALKVLRPELAHALGPERFQREIRLAARLQHPHVLGVLDSGAVDGQLWFTMPYVEGESLRARLTRERQLAVRDALRIVQEAAHGLQYAHEHGIVHRDVKPDNILLTADGSTLVADFGIARAFAGASEPETGETLTRTGVSVGTPAYMSPEQASGDRAVDARSDVYSLGAVLYELLAGEPPFTGATPQAIVAKRFSQPVPSVRTVRPNVPEAVDRALQRALALVPGDRFATMTAFADALAPAPAPASAVPHPGPLRRYALISALVLGLALGGGLLFAWRRVGGPERAPAAAAASAVAAGPPRLAVLPFENLGDSADAYFADGITDAVRGKLTALAGLQVIARSSSVPYRGTREPPAAIATELGVRYLLTGTVRWAKAPDGTSRVQVSPELVEVTGGATGTAGAAASRWQQPFDAPLTDVFQVQADIASRVAEALQVALPGATQAELARAPTADPAAYDAFLRGEAAWDAGANTSPAAIRRALGHYEQAVARDAAFTAAWARLADAAARLYANSTPTPALAARARAAALRAAALEPDGAVSHLALGRYYQFVEQDVARALTELEAAYRRAPGDATVVGLLAFLQATAGHWDAALQHGPEAVALDPRSAQQAGRLASIQIYLRHLPEARAAADRELALAPRNVTAVQDRVLVALAEGDLAGARRMIAAAAGEIPAAELAAYFATYSDLGWVLDDAGQRLALALGPEAYDGDRGAWGLVRAQLHGWRGDTAQSRVWADTAARAFAAQLRGAPKDPQRHVLRGLALAYAGRRAEALAEAERGLALARAAPNGFNDPYFAHQLVRIHLLLGERDQALAGLEALLRRPYLLTPAWLRIDPTFAPLRGDPRFERLARGTP
ncbi:MAG TPA: protein kinase, partial [Gemmatimonadales bacterium]|nr:protein kinase [Gemmatimonadales bacterium]